MNGASDGNSTPMTDIHDIKPLLSMGPDLQWLYWVLGTLALGALALLARYLWRRRKKTAPSIPAPPPVAPHIEAGRALDGLATQTGISAKQYYFRLSAILRRYLERRFGFPAAEMTTEELLPRLDGLPLDADLIPAVKALCRSADPIKFAGAGAVPKQMHDDMATVRRFVRRTTIEDGVASEQSPGDKPAKLPPSGGRAAPTGRQSIEIRET
jgi:hypothetical protein